MTSTINLQTVQYKQLEDGTSIYLNVHVPKQLLNSQKRTTLSLPTVIDFHGGGFTVGDRNNVPEWLLNRMLELGYLVISPDYQLLPSSTGHDIINDIQDAMTYLSTAEFRFDDGTFSVNFDAVAFSGSSAGGVCALIAAMNCTSPKPKAILSVYGGGGNLLTPFYFQPKTEPFLTGLGVPLLDVSIFNEYVFPFPEKLPCLSSSPFNFIGSQIGGTDLRGALHLIYLQLGTFLDYYTGQHSPSLSETIRKGIAEGVPVEELVPGKHRKLFPQLADASVWPPILWLHGTEDTIIPFSQPIYFAELLRSQEVQSIEVLPVEGKEHGFDNIVQVEAEKLYGAYFDSVKDFLSTHLR